MVLQSIPAMVNPMKETRPDPTLIDHWAVHSKDEVEGEIIDVDAQELLTDEEAVAHEFADEDPDAWLQPEINKKHEVGNVERRTMKKRSPCCQFRLICNSAIWLV